MGIQALPQTTVRAIGASQVLTDPAAVVKELIDNALDAHATTIAVEISGNTLDVIQVRDNGHGIAPEDRPMVARRHCTSKISGEDDLRVIGGSSLGFRGEALASAAEMSGSLTISTRVEGEGVATTLKISQQGEVVDQERSSFAVGTTVRLADFVKTNPVRRQVALKATEKCLKKIKSTLQAYALARPRTRLSLRVLKAKNEKGNFTYAPQAGATIAQDAALKILGSACTSQCAWLEISQEDFTLQAYLPRSDSNPAKVSNVGAFISVDGRPMSSTRGIAKQLAKIFRDRLKDVNRQFDGIKDPFLYLAIACPAESYDANIEPAKDDVLFENADKVVARARDLFTAAYPEVVQQQSTLDGRNVQPPQSSAKQTFPGDAGDILLNISSLQPSTPAPPIGDDLNRSFAPRVPTMVGDAELPAMAQRSLRSNMYGGDEDDLGDPGRRPLSGRSEADMEELRMARKDITVSNPWVLARLNAPVARAGRMYDAYPISDTTASSPIRNPELQQAAMLPTPRPSSPSLPQDAFHPSDHIPGRRHAPDGRLISSAALPTPVTPRRQGKTLPHALLKDTTRLQTPAYDYDPSFSASNIALGTALDDIPDARERPRPHLGRRRAPAASVDKSFVPPTNTSSLQENAWFDHLQGIERAPRPNYQRSRTHGLVRQGDADRQAHEYRLSTSPSHNRDIRDWIALTDNTDDDLGAAFLTDNGEHPPPKQRRSMQGSADNGIRILEAENMTQPNAMNAKGFVPASKLPRQHSDHDPEHFPKPLHKRRKTRDSQPLRQISGNAVELAGEEYIPVDKTRAVSRRRDTTEVDPNRLRRRKSSNLPLERVPAKQRTHNLVVKCNQDMDKIAVAADREVSSVLAWNQPAVHAYDAYGEGFQATEVNELAVRLGAFFAVGNPGKEVILDLVSVLSGALARHAGGAEASEE